MSFRYQCDNRRRISLVEDHATLNGIEYLEVLDNDAPAGSPPQQTLLVRTLKDLPAPPDAFTADNVRITGGVRVTNVKVVWVGRGLDIADLLANGTITANEHDYFSTLDEQEKLLIVRTDSAGDFSTYTLQLVQSETDDSPPVDFDTVLSCVDFSFKVECPSEFDCAEDNVCTPEPYEEPEIDYLAKDYNSFRQLMFDRMSVLMPDWTERNPADAGVVMVELLAYVGDYLSYYQDAVATEAYLGTARKRVSVRRHARLLDYNMHDGCNARTWIALEVEGSADAGTLPASSPFSTKPGRSDEKAIVFETMHDQIVHAGHNRIAFYTWGDTECWLPKGSTNATLLNDGLHLAKGDVLILEEVVSPSTGLEADANPENRHAVRLIDVEVANDPLDGQALLEITWHDQDALPFPLCLSATLRDGTLLQNVSVARGNVILADHGSSVVDDPLLPATVPSQGRYQPELPEQGVCFGVNYQHSDATGRSAQEVLNQDPRAALPLVRLNDADEVWNPQRDLLASDRFATEFVLETETDGSARIRFGDDTLGKAPSAGKTFTANYRLGGGRSGNTGRDAVVQYNGDLDWALTGITSVRNPLPAVGGLDPELLEEVRQYAPQAFRVQERAVTAEDYMKRAEEHPQVQKATARFRWTGSWYTVFVTVDRVGGLSVDDDPDFEREIREWLDRFRVAGYDLEIAGPIFVPLNLTMEVCVKSGYFRATVKRSLLETFSRYDLSGGRRGFFHPDNFTFGDPLYLSRLYQQAMKVEGVASVEVTQMERWGKKANGEIEAGKLETASLEIIRLDNDPSAPENGKIEFIMQGGL